MVALDASWASRAGGRHGSNRGRLDGRAQRPTCRHSPNRAADLDVGGGSLLCDRRNGLAPFRRPHARDSEAVWVQTSAFSRTGRSRARESHPPDGRPRTGGGRGVDRCGRRFVEDAFFGQHGLADADPPALAVVDLRRVGDGEVCASGTSSPVRACLADYVLGACVDRSSISRRWALPRRIKREICICEHPSRLPISACVRFSLNRIMSASRSQ